MNVNPYLGGYINVPITIKNDVVNQTKTQQGNHKFQTGGYLPNQPKSPIFTIQPNRVSVEEYKANLSELRKQAILQAATPTIKVGRNEDGTIWADSVNLSPEQALAKKREIGGELEISWRSVEVNLAWHSLGKLETLDQIGSGIDYYASEYAQYKTRIEQSFTGEKQLAELEKLDKLFSEQIDKQASLFADTVGGFLEKNGVKGEQSAIKSSILTMYEQLKQDYLGFIEKNDDYAGVKGTVDEWLTTAGDFMGDQLRYAYRSQHPNTEFSSNGAYTVEDLTAAGALVKAVGDIGNDSASLNQSEEELGVKLGLMAMKWELISGHYAMSDGMKSKLNKSVQGLVDNQLNRMKEYIEQQRIDPYVRNKEAYAVDYNAKSVLDIIKKMVSSLSTTDMNASFKKDISTVLAMYKDKMINVQTSGLSRYNVYYSAWSNENYASEWNKFVKNLLPSDASSRYLLNENLSFIDVKA